MVQLADLRQFRETTLLQASPLPGQGTETVRIIVSKMLTLRLILR
jgi:hypothetical protein